MSPFASSNLPPDIGRATLHASVYMILQPIRRTALNVTTQTGELLPHLFTLTPINRSGYFLLRYSALANSFPLGNMVLCVARTFLHSTREKRQTDLLFNCKDRDNILNLFDKYKLFYFSYLKDRKELIKEKFLYSSTIIYFCC